jgi:hypothetical protein
MYRMSSVCFVLEARKTNIGSHGVQRVDTVIPVPESTLVKYQNLIAFADNSYCELADIFCLRLCVVSSIGY